MATVGINFGAASSGAGFDVAATVTSILAIQSAVETPWKAQLTSLQAQDAALSGLGAGLSSLSTAVSALTDFQGVLASKQGSSSNTNLLSLSSASTSAIAGSHTIEVRSLAQTSSNYSDQITDASDTLSGSLSIGIGNGRSQTITVDASSDTLATLASAINSGTYGVTASVVTDTHGSRLSLVSNASGAAGQIALTSNLQDATSATSLAFSSGQTGADAALTVDGLGTTSASNTVTGAIPGVTFQLLSAAIGTNVQVQITNNNGAIEAAMQTLVTAYNAVAAGIKTQEGKDASGKAQPLYGDPTLALLQTQLSSGLLNGAGSGAVTDLSKLGLTLKQDGTLSLDASKLDGTLNTHFSDVTSYLQNIGGFGMTLSKAIDTLGSTSTTGALSLALQQNASEETAINASVSTEDARIAAQKITLTAQLNTANQILQSIPQQLNEQTQIYNAITGYKGG